MTARPRVLHLIKGLGPGGAENLLLAMAQREAASSPFDVAYILPFKDHLVAPLEATGVKVYRLNARHPFDPRWLVRLRRLIISQNYEVVHLHSPLLSAFARPMLRVLRRTHEMATVSTEHNAWQSHNRWTRFANTLTFPLGDAWIAVSDETRQSMPRRYRNRVKVVLNGVDVPAIAQFRDERSIVRSELGLTDDHIAVITVANLRAQKDYPNLLEAARIACAEDERFRFFAVGQGPLAEEMAQLKEDEGLGDQFSFLGYRDDVRRLLSGMDIYTQASMHEGIPLAVMEAMAAGLPVVATAVGGVPHAVANGETGWLVPSGDPQALAAAYRAMSSDERRMEDMAHASRIAAQRFDISAVSAALDEVYAEVLERRPSGRHPDDS